MKIIVQLEAPIRDKEVIDAANDIKIKNDFWVLNILTISYNLSILAAKTKSLSASPSMACVEILILA